jgi:hypothetical protein
VAGLSIGVVVITLGFALVVGVVAVAYVYNKSASVDEETSLPQSRNNQDIEKTSQPRPVIRQDNSVRQPERVLVVDKTFPVAAHNYIYYTIPLKAEMTHMTGHFTAQVGNNDIEVFVLDKDGFTNFSNGHNSATYYNSGGYVTTGSIDLNLRPGTYYVVFNNSRAMLTNKVVTAKIEAMWP